MRRKRERSLRDEWARPSPIGRGAPKRPAARTLLSLAGRRPTGCCNESLRRGLRPASARQPRPRRTK